jgi:hypothetical protein
MLLRVASALVAVAVIAAAAGARAQAAPDADAMFHATTLQISAYGEVKAAPDQAVITLGVQTTDPTAAQAMADNASHMSAVIASLRRQGLEGKDVQTSGVDLSAQYDYQPNKPRRLIGYQASNQVTVTVEDLARLGPALDAATAAGANEVQGVNFRLKDPGATENQARLEAVKALEAKAQLYAGATGYHVARLVRLSEGGAAGPRPMANMVNEVVVTAARRQQTPIEPGELTIHVDVSGVYELAR